MTSTSLEKRLVILPRGVVSKKRDWCVQYLPQCLVEHVVAGAGASDGEADAKGVQEEGLRDAEHDIYADVGILRQTVFVLTPPCQPEAGEDIEALRQAKQREYECDKHHVVGR